MERFEFHDLTVLWSRHEACERLVFTGRSTSRHPALILGPMWSQVLSVAKDGGHLIELDFTKLEHFNSSTISTLVQFMNEAHDARVKLVLRYDAALKWQALSFEALQRGISAFADGSVTFVRHP